MKTTLRSPIFEGGSIIREFSKDFNSKDLKEQQSKVGNHLVNGSVSEIQLDGIYLVRREAQINKPYTVEVTHDFPLFKLHFELEGWNQYEPDDANSLPVVIPSGHFNLFYFPHVSGNLSFVPPRRRTLEIQFTKAYIQKALGKNYKTELAEFGLAIANQSAYVLWQKSQPISHKMYDEINAIQLCNYSPSLKKAFLEAKVMELLVMVFDKYKQDTEGSVKASPEQIPSHILLLCHYIKDNLSEPLTNQALAAIAGINLSKLKADFKSAMGTSVFRYITHLRMEKAYQAIREDKASIAEASHLVGYKNPHHFTVAFKKCFGFLPSEAKNLRRD